MNAQDKAEQQLHALIRNAVHTALMATPLLEVVSETADRTTTAVLKALHQRAHDPAVKHGGWLFVAQGAHIVTDYSRESWNDETVWWDIATVADDDE